MLQPPSDIGYELVSEWGVDEELLLIWRKCDYPVSNYRIEGATAAEKVVRTWDVLPDSGAEDEEFESQTLFDTVDWPASEVVQVRLIAIGTDGECSLPSAWFTFD